MHQRAPHRIGRLLVAFGICAAVVVATGGTAQRAEAGPDCLVGVITKISNPALTGPSPTYSGNTVTSSGGSWTSCGDPFTGFYKEWLRNGVVFSGPTWVAGNPGSFTYTAAYNDITTSLSAGVNPCNADGCYGSYALSNGLSVSDRSPSPPTNFSPADGTTGNTTTPTLSSTFSDGDGGTGYVRYTVKRATDGVVVATGNGTTVNSGSSSAWTVPAGSLVTDMGYNWYAQAFDAFGASSVSSSAVSDFSNPRWQYDDCATDGSATADTATCMSSGDAAWQEPASADGCTGTDTFCDASIADIQAAGYSTTELNSAASIEAAGNPDFVNGPYPHGPQSGGFTGRWAWLTFALYTQPSNCPPSSVYDNGHCGDFWYSWQQYTNGSPGATHYSLFRARSGDNYPPDKWTVRVGPIPDAWASSSPAGYAYHHLGWQFRHYSGYVRSSSDAFYPGLWPTDPWNIYSSAGVHRNAFELHGGWSGHEYEVSRTEGCIRVRYQVIPTIKGKWDNDADNKHSAPGPTIYVFLF